MNDLRLFSFLESSVPKGGLIGVVFPKSVLGKILPVIAERKKCSVVYLGDAQGFSPFSKFSVSGKSLYDADVIFAEPSFFTHQGGFFLPSEAEKISSLPLVGVGAGNFISNNPSDLDFVHLEKTITDLGVFTPDTFAEELE